ncbi:laccase [Kitasatospora sp. MMS16-BH015]|uniref:peptidoglycan editing factor PgeF n=1 Tax=Kitasatospora sp. MMS16-BH015 TaxID=2018025 RepID=UPI000CA263DF|nr:peptidoglycan editing factor PgeF [Kitasatospora sp. MMS16-BH015]AUG76315.1 laccase [Kitasatospora sp. MMS16-BH015]
MDTQELGPGIRYAVATRHGGVGTAPYDSRNLSGAVGDDPETVRRNRELTARELGLAPDRVVLMRQVHSRDVTYVTEPFGAEAPPLDAVFTDRPGLGLAALSADCAPVLLADPVARLVGAAHSGRVGTVSGVVPALVEAMAARGAEPARMVALVGPLACGLCYEVSEELRAEGAAALPELYATTRQGTPSLDVRAGITAQLARAGVGEVRQDERCTIEDRDFFSYRRDRTTGRFAAYVWLTD